MIGELLGSLVQLARHLKTHLMIGLLVFFLTTQNIHYRQVCSVFLEYTLSLKYLINNFPTSNIVVQVKWIIGF